MRMQTPVTDNQFEESQKIQTGIQVMEQKYT